MAARQSSHSCPLQPGPHPQTLAPWERAYLAWCRPQLTGPGQAQSPAQDGECQKQTQAVLGASLVLLTVVALGEGSGSLLVIVGVRTGKLKGSKALGAPRPPWGGALVIPGGMNCLGL